MGVWKVLGMQGELEVLMREISILGRKYLGVRGNKVLTWGGHWAVVKELGHAQDT